MTTSRDIVLNAWQRLKPHLAQQEQDAANEWCNRYRPETSEVETYIHGSLDRFALLLDAIGRHLPQGTVLDAGAGYGIQSVAFSLAGYRSFASDVYPPSDIYNALDVEYRQWNLEAEPAPFEDHCFDAIILSQTIEHFTYSPLQPIREMLRILKPGGLLLIDAPNISSFNNVWRLIRGKTIHWSLKKHYLEQEPNIVNGVPYFDRHNREYSMQDFEDIASFFGLEIIERAYYSPLNRHGKPVPALWLSRLRDIVPHWRKGLYCLFRIKS